MSGSIWLALGLILIFEGLLPFAMPALWRAVLARVSAMTDAQIRLFGSILLGTGLLIFLASSSNLPVTG